MEKNNNDTLNELLDELLKETVTDSVENSAESEETAVDESVNEVIEAIADDVDDEAAETVAEPDMDAQQAAKVADVAAEDVAGRAAETFAEDAVEKAADVAAEEAAETAAEEATEQAVNSGRDKVKKEKRRPRFFPKKTVHQAMVLINLLVTGVLMVMLVLVDALPKELVVVILALMAIGLVVIWRLLCMPRKSKRRLIGAILSVVFTLGVGTTSYYMIQTYSAFNRITTVGAQCEYFHVIAPKDNSYDKEEDIKGMRAFVVDSVDPNYAKAQQQLKDEMGISYDTLHTVKGIMKRTIGEKTKPSNLVFISETTYEMLCEEYENYKDDTKILYTVKLELDNNDIAKRTNVTEQPFNIYVSGIDVFGEINQVSRSDVNMIVTVNPKTKKILLTSIPRDSYVVLHSYEQYDKLTHSGIYGVNETVSTVEDWLGTDINYYLRVNFTTLVDVINAIGGVDVYSPVAFESSIHDCSYVKGMNHLDGKQALYFARERHAFEAEDEARNQNQQRVMKAILKKMLSSTTLLTSYDSILAAVQDEMQTNMSTQEISSLVKMQLDDFQDWTIETANVHGAGEMAGTFSMGMSRMLYVSVPDEASVQKVQKKIDNVMNPSEEEMAEAEARLEANRKESFWDKVTFWN